MIRQLALLFSIFVIAIGIYAAVVNAMFVAVR